MSLKSLIDEQKQFEKRMNLLKLQLKKDADFYNERGIFFTRVNLTAEDLLELFKTDKDSNVTYLSLKILQNRISNDKLYILLGLCVYEVERDENESFSDISLSSFTYFGQKDFYKERVQNTIDGLKEEQDILTKKIKHLEAFI